MRYNKKISIEEVALVFVSVAALLWIITLKG